HSLHFSGCTCHLIFYNNNVFANKRGAPPLPTMTVPRIIALILAGGEGTRAAQAIPKQYVQIEGIPILAYTMRAFDRHPLIDDIYVVCRDKWADLVRRISTELAFTKFRDTITAGETSIASISNGISTLANIFLPPSPSADQPISPIILVHDGVRPLVSSAVITDAITVCRRHGNAIAAMQGEEAYMTGDALKATSMIPREQLWGAQTPHTFPLSTLVDVFKEAEARGIGDSQSLYTLMAELGHWPLYKSRGERVNIKITHPEDIWFFSRLVSVL
ncbi:MAG: 2-C-methyl-D-erythritol 4-phosphate cytidylyltransferase, partial [Bacteroidales bacterium]|nr:2-C-methyl-D-erythritol 4-phosphate cytidylyltransferase [Bacteroidales bacterium]